MVSTVHTDVLVLGSGTAGSNSARAAVRAGASTVTLVQPCDLINTCVEEGCMPSKSVLAGAHQGESRQTIEETRDTHIDRLLGSLRDGLQAGGFTIVGGTAEFIDSHTVQVTQADGVTNYYADAIVIATGSEPFVPPITGLAELELGRELYTSAEMVAKDAPLTSLPSRVLTVGAGPIGLEMSTFLHDSGVDVFVLQRDKLLGAFDPEFGQERQRASTAAASFPIYTESTLTEVRKTDAGLECCCTVAGDEVTYTVDAIMMATGRTPRINDLALAKAEVALDDRGALVHNEYLQTSQPHIYVAGDVVGHHQILHYAAKMGAVAGANAARYGERVAMDFDRYLLAISFDAYPSALIGLTETDATDRGMAVVTATKYFKDFGLGILKRQEYGLFKVVAEAGTGRILGSQIVGPDSAGELIQIFSPIIHNRNTAYDLLEMTWYHPTYAEAIESLAKQIVQQL